MTWQHVLDVINNLVAFLLRVAGLGVTVVIVYNGFRMVIAGSDASAYAKAPKRLIWALLGAVIIFGAYTIIATIRGGVDSIGS